MLKQFHKTDYLLWSIIVVYTGIIYATLSLVTRIQKTLVEKYGRGVFDHIYWFFAAAGLVVLYYCFHNYKGGKLAAKLTIVAFFAALYCYLLSGMKYPVERIHFLQYGLLGILCCVAFDRHIRHWIAILLSLNLVYWIGLGDEAIQGLLASRVGEIRDSITNLISGVLGVFLFRFIVKSPARAGALHTVHLRALLLFLAVSTIGTALFLYAVHGFGYTILRRDPGIVRTALPQAVIQRINNRAAPVTRQTMAIYENEAVRHLFQREFYFTNDYKAADGTFYKDYHRCFGENRVLEVFYPRYLEDRATEKTGPLISGIDRNVGARVMDNPVLWPDSLRARMEKLSGWGSATLFTSRVKSLIITGFTLRDLLFYSALILVFFGYLWFRLPGRARDG